MDAVLESILTGFLAVIDHGPNAIPNFTCSIKMLHNLLHIAVISSADGWR